MFDRELPGRDIDGDRLRNIGILDPEPIHLSGEMLPSLDIEGLSGRDFDGPNDPDLDLEGLSGRDAVFELDLEGVSGRDIDLDCDLDCDNDLNKKFSFSKITMKFNTFYTILT